MHDMVYTASGRRCLRFPRCCESGSVITGRARLRESSRSQLHRRRNMSCDEVDGISRVNEANWRKKKRPMDITSVQPHAVAYKQTITRCIHVVCAPVNGLDNYYERVISAHYTFCVNSRLRESLHIFRSKLYCQVEKLSGFIRLGKIVEVLRVCLRLDFGRKNVRINRST